MHFLARKRAESLIPIIRADRDIRHLVSESTSRSLKIANMTNPSVYSMFVTYSDCHIFRAVESGLRLRHKQRHCELYKGNIVDQMSAALYGDCVRSRNRNAGSKGQLAKLVLEYQNQTLM